MKNFIIIILILYGCTTCSDSNNADNNDTISTLYEKLEFKTDSTNPNTFGFKIINYTEEGLKRSWYFGVNSILLIGDYAYLTDESYGNIKRIDINTKEVEVSKNFGDKGYKNRLIDIIPLKDKLFILTDAYTNYIISEELAVLDSFKLKSGNKFLYKVKDSSFDIFTANGLFSIDSNGTVINEQPNFNWSAFLSFTHGKEFKVLSNSNYSIIKTQYGNIKLNSLFSSIDYYDAINLDFDDEKLVYFEVKPDVFILHIYRYKK